MPADFSIAVDEAKVVIVDQQCTLGLVHFLNGDAAIRYLQFFDTDDAATVTLGTTPPFYVVHMGASAGGTVIIPRGLVFTDGITVAATTTASGSTGVTADAFVSVVWD